MSSDSWKCPNCGAQMDVVEDTDMQICPNCKTLAWEESGELQWRVPQKISEAELEAEIAAEEGAIREYPKYIIPHADHGDPECPGLIMADIRGDTAELVCNDCGAVLSTVPAAEAESKLAEMASGELCSATCPHCGQLNMFPGFSVML